MIYLNFNENLPFNNNIEFPTSKIPTLPSKQLLKQLNNFN